MANFSKGKCKRVANVTAGPNNCDLQDRKLITTIITRKRVQDSIYIPLKNSKAQRYARQWMFCVLTQSGIYTYRIVDNLRNEKV